MALTKSVANRAVQASATNTAGSTTTTSGQLISYGVSGVAVITNGGTGPTVACSVYVDFSADNSNWITGPAIGVGDTVNSSVTRIPYGFGPGGPMGDFAYYRLRFTGNTAQSVTVQADDATTTSY
jgi:hypothetical protein